VRYRDPQDGRHRCIHLLAPIQRRASLEDTYAFAKAASRLLEARHPGI
jgi:DNA primase